MSVVKSKRGQSKIEFEMIYFKLADGVDTLVEHEFFAEGMLAIKNKVFLEMRSRTLEDLTDKLLYHIKIANSIYPTCIAEWEERRVAIGKERRQSTKYSFQLQYRNGCFSARLEDVSNIHKQVNLTKRVLFYGNPRMYSRRRFYT